MPAASEENAPACLFCTNRISSAEMNTPFSASPHTCHQNHFRANLPDQTSTLRADVSVHGASTTRCMVWKPPLPQMHQHLQTIQNFSRASTTSLPPNESGFPTKG